MKIKSLIVGFCLLTGFIACAQTKAYVLDVNEGIEMERGFEAELKASPNTTGSYLFTITHKPFWFRTPLHKRPASMSFYILEGEFHLYVDSKIHVLKPGQFAFVPADTPVAYCSCDPKQYTKWVHVFTPGDQVVEFWEAMFTRGENREKGLEVKPLPNLAAEFNVQYLDPPPFTKPETP